MNTPSAWSERARAFTDPWTACGWSEASQKARFAEVLAAVKPRPGERLLDVGCGTGEFSEWLPAAVTYVGFDTAPGMIHRAAREHPGRVFQSWEPSQSFDVTVVIGAFNLPVAGGKEAVFHVLRHRWERTRRAMAVSLYAGDDERCLCYSEADCAPLLGESWRSSVRRWRRNDLLLVLEK